MFEDAAQAVRLARAAGATIVINDRVDVALALRADGVHLGQSDLPVPAARKLLGRYAIIGYSTHNIEQARLALDLPIDYLAIGPVFPTQSKHNPDPVVGLDGLRSVKLVVHDLPLVAIGGIRGSALSDVFAAGADSAAIISEILAPPQNIRQNLRNLLAIA